MFDINLDLVIHCYPGSDPTYRIEFNGLFVTCDPSGVPQRGDLYPLFFVLFIMVLNKF